MTNNLSEVVESLLADFVSKERARRDAHAKALKEAIVTWNAFDEKHGSFADEHSTL
jgi:antitoxin CcdA